MIPNVLLGWCSDSNLFVCLYDKTMQACYTYLYVGGRLRISYMTLEEVTSVTYQTMIQT